MAYNRDLQIASQKLAGETLIALYTIDATSLGAGIYHITNHSEPDGSPIRFGGVEFAPIPMQTSGWELVTEGAMPRPSMKVSTLGPIFNALVRNYDNGVGAIVTRQRTFARFLDGHESPDPTAQFSVDIYRVNEKKDESNGVIEWELASFFDVEGAKIPARQILRDTCTHLYRRWNGSFFDYSKATCPYAGSSYYLKNGSATNNPSQDACGKKLSDCKLRFGISQPLYTRAFPGVGRTQI